MAPKKVPKARPKAKAKVAPPGKAEQDKVRAIFKDWDADGDGMMNMVELTNLVVSLGFPAGDVEPLFERADLNKDGKVDLEEFLQWIYDAAPVAVQGFAKSGGASDKDAQKKLDEMLVETFKCFDEDKDGMLERVELLNVSERIYDKMGEVFNVKTRKATVAWFKAAGATGDPGSGMYLTYEKWKAAYLATLTEKAGATIAEPGKLAEYLYENIAKPLFEITYPPAAVAAEVTADGAGAAAAPAAGPPAYPITIPFRELKNALADARRWERSALILSSKKDEVETFLNYQQMQLVDCMKMVNEIFVRKTSSKAEGQEQASKALKFAMNSHGFCQPLHVRLGTSAFDLQDFCAPGTFPAEIFSPALWTPDEALKGGFIDDGQKLNVEIEDFKKWKDFHVVISSKQDLDFANEHLVSRIPHYDELAIIVIDPKSIED